ncbi:hypothetical protein BC943DRAFT_331979 [Umbelopsis sp. AD052]|nr:hypothetical protein BC943DRAFT_331979 [Umbelopsis sp. AD052]
MQGFTVFLAIAAVILSCGPQFSTAAPSPYPLHYITKGGENKPLPVVLDLCQSLPDDLAAVDNTTPFGVFVFTEPGCQGDATRVAPGLKVNEPPTFVSVLVLRFS